MAHFISEEELRKMETAENVLSPSSDREKDGKSQLSERDKRRLNRDKRREEQERIRVELEKGKTAEGRRKRELEKKRREAEEREKMRIEAEEEERRNIENEEKEIESLRKRRMILQERLEHSVEQFEMEEVDELDYSDFEFDFEVDLSSTHDGIHGEIEIVKKVGDPFDQSTDVDEVNQSPGSVADNGQDDSLEQSLFWIEKKWKEMNIEESVNHPGSNTKPVKSNRSSSRNEHSMETKPKQIKEEQKREVKRVLPKIKTEKRKTGPVIRAPIRRVQESNDDTERNLKEKVERLQSKEKEMARRIQIMKLKKEKERQIREEQGLRQDRIRKLKEQQTSLIESLREQESILSELESTVTEESDEDHEGGTNREYHGRKQEKKERRKSSKHKEKDERTVHTVSFRKPTIPKLTEDTFEEWKIEVEVVMKSGLYHADIVRQEVRNSLSGSTRKILLNMDPSASTRELVTKLENVYGNIRTGESVLAEFYQAKQKETENVAEWGVRVESILNTAIKKGQVKTEQADEMLRNRFWRHLRSDYLKNATRVFYETAKSFEDLRRRVRIEENEIDSAKESGKSGEKVVKAYQRSDNEQLTMMKNLLARMEKLEQQISKQPKQGEGTRHESQHSSTERNPRTDESQGKGNWYSRGNWSRSNYRNRRYRYGNNYDRNRTPEQKQSDKSEQGQEHRTSKSLQDEKVSKQTNGTLN